jgi:hypothetical protein
LFVRFWLTATLPPPDTAQLAAQTKGRERYEGFVEALGRRLAGVRRWRRRFRSTSSRRKRRQPFLVSDLASLYFCYATARRLI